MIPASESYCCVHMFTDVQSTACSICVVGQISSEDAADQKEMTAHKSHLWVGWKFTGATSGPGTSCLSCSLKPKAPADQEFNLAGHIFEKNCHLSWFYHRSLLLFLLAIIAKPPWRSAKFLASFINIAWDRSVISWISAELSCSAPTSPCVSEEIISPTKSTTFPRMVSHTNRSKGHWYTLQLSSAHWPLGLGFYQLWMWLKFSVTERLKCKSLV